jgi:hypothetical protein
MNADLSAEVEQLYKIKSAQYIRARNRTKLRSTQKVMRYKEKVLAPFTSLYSTKKPKIPVDL